MNVLVYNLKRNYPQAVTLIHKRSDGVDLETGSLVKNEARYELQHVAWVPTDVSPAWPSFPQQGSFAVSQGFDLGVAKVLVDKADLPVDFLVSINDHLLKGLPPTDDESDERVQYFITRVIDLQKFGAIELVISDTPKTEGLAR